MKQARWMIMSVVGLAACSNLLGIDDFTGDDLETADDRDVPAGGAGGTPGVGGGNGSGASTPAMEAWALAFGSAVSSDAAKSVTVNAADEVVIAGTIGDDVDFGGGKIGGANALFVTRLSADGEHLMSTASSGNAVLTLAGAAIDVAGNVAVAGSIASGTFSVVTGGTPHVALPADDRDIFVAKLSEDGDELWSHAFAAAGAQDVHAVAVDPSDGAVVIVGSLRDSLGFDASTTLTSAGGDDALIARFRADGQLDWALSAGDGNSQVARAVTVDEAGTIWVAGTFNGTVNLGGDTHTSVGNSDIFLVKLSSAGAVATSARFGEGGQHSVGALAPHDGGVVMVGGFVGTTSFGGDAFQSQDGTVAAEDIFVASLDANAKHLFSRSFGGSAFDRATSVAVDRAGQVFVGGSFSGTLSDLGLDSAGDRDALVLALHADGEPAWRIGFGRHEEDEVTAVAIDGAGAVVAVGHFADAFTLGEDVVFGPGLDDIFVAKLVP